MRGLAPLLGHERLRASLAEAAARGALPAALLLLGPPGVGKQRLALWLAQHLECERRGELEPCGLCTACRLTLRLEHPDVHWFFPLPRPKVSGGSDRLGDALEEARAAELETRRANPRYTTRGSEPAGIYLAHAQVIRRLAVPRPAMGQRKVFIIGDAEWLVPQEANPEAANALLKLLEEPPPQTTIVLTAADADALLPTIRSRLLTIRVNPLSDEEVERYLRQDCGVDAADAARVTRLAEGSIGRAMAFLPADGEPGPLESARVQALALLDAALAGGSARFSRALAQAPSGARGDFATVLAMLIIWLRDMAALSAGAEDAVINVDRLEDVRRRAAAVPDAARRVAGAIAEVEQMLQLVTTNINPQLALGVLLGALSRSLGPKRGAPARQPARKAR